MGADGESALKAAITTPDRNARARLLMVAARIPGAAYMPELMTSLYTLPPESDTYRQVTKVLSPAGQALPQAAASQRYIINQMESRLNEFKVLRRETSPSIHSVWRWSPDAKRLITELDDAAGVHLERAYQLAMLAIQLGPHSGTDSALATAVIFERNYRLSPLLEFDSDAFRQTFLPVEQIENLDYLGLVWDLAKRWHLTAAQLRSVQAIGLALNKGPTDPGASMSRLSDAVKNSAPAIRYAAAVALSQRRDSEESFEGRYAYEQTKREMQALESKPLALLVGGSVELRDTLSNQLSALGIRSKGTSSARETLRLIQEPQPIEYVFLVDRVLEMSLSELVQRIRAYPKTSELPMAILTDQLGSTQRRVLADEGIQNVYYSSVTANIDLTASLLSEMQRSSSVPKMDSIDRLLFQSRFEPVSK